MAPAPNLHHQEFIQLYYLISVLLLRVLLCCNIGDNLTSLLIKVGQATDSPYDRDIRSHCLQRTSSTRRPNQLLTISYHYFIHHLKEFTVIVLSCARCCQLLLRPDPRYHCFNSQRHLTSGEACQVGPSIQSQDPPDIILSVNICSTKSVKVYGFTKLLQYTTYCSAISSQTKSSPLQQIRTSLSRQPLDSRSSYNHRQQKSNISNNRLPPPITTISTTQHSLRFVQREFPTSPSQRSPQYTVHYLSKRFRSINKVHGKISPQSSANIYFSLQTGSQNSHRTSAVYRSKDLDRRSNSYLKQSSSQDNSLSTEYCVLQRISSSTTSGTTQCLQTKSKEFTNYPSRVNKFHISSPVPAAQVTVHAYQSSRNTSSTTSFSTIPPPIFPSAIVPHCTSTTVALWCNIASTGSTFSFNQSTYFAILILHCLIQGFQYFARSILHFYYTKESSNSSNTQPTYTTKNQIIYEPRGVLCFIRNRISTSVGGVVQHNSTVRTSSTSVELASNSTTSNSRTAQANHFLPHRHLSSKISTSQGSIRPVVSTAKAIRQCHINTRFLFHLLSSLTFRGRRISGLLYRRNRTCLGRGLLTFINFYTGIVPQSAVYNMSSENTITKPALASSQLKFTTADALADLQSAPSYSYTIMVFLRCRSGTTFSTVAYTEQVKHFIGVCKAGDPEFIVLKKRQSARMNAITRSEEVPSNTLEFEEDYAKDVSVDKQSHWVRFRISVASSLRFYDLFCDDTHKTYQLIRKHKWHVDVTSLEHDCYMVHIGWFKYLHPVFTNREDLKQDFDKYFASIIKDYDFTSRYKRRTYSTVKDDGSEKRDTCHIRVISMYVPVDIAFSASRSIVEYWGNELMEERKKQIDPLTPTNRLLLSEFIPNSKKLLPEEDQVQHLLDQGKFLTDFKDAVFIYDCLSIDTVFHCSEQIAISANAEQFKDQHTTLRKILLSWADNDTQEKIVKGVEQMTHSRFAVIAHTSVIAEVRRVLYSIIETMRKELSETEFKLLGGNVADGMRVDDPKGLLQPAQARSYLDRLQHSTHYVKVGKYRAQPSNPKRSCVVTNTNNSQAQRIYSDVLVPKGMTNSTVLSNNTTSLVLSSKDGHNKQLSTIDDFNKLVQQQVEKIIAPSIEKLNTTINTVQTATSRVEKLEAQSEQIKTKQDALTDTVNQSMKTINDMMQSNLKAMREETQSMQTTNNNQFQQLLTMLQSTVPSTSNTNVTTNNPSSLSSITNSAASTAALSTQQFTTKSNSTQSTTSSSPSAKRKLDAAMHRINSLDDLQMEVSESFNEGIMNQLSMDDAGSHKPTSSAMEQSPPQQGAQHEEVGRMS